MLQALGGGGKGGWRKEEGEVWVWVEMEGEKGRRFEREGEEETGLGFILEGGRKGVHGGDREVRRRGLGSRAYKERGSI